jgi:hypothetical protein
MLKSVHKYKIEKATSVVWMRCSLVNLKALTVIANTATVFVSSIPASSDTLESAEWQMKQF